MSFNNVNFNENLLSFSIYFTKVKASLKPREIFGRERFLFESEKLFLRLRVLARQSRREKAIVRFIKGETFVVCFDRGRGMKLKFAKPRLFDAQVRSFAVRCTAIYTTSKDTWREVMINVESWQQLLQGSCFLLFLSPG